MSARIDTKAEYYIVVEKAVLTVQKRSRRPSPGQAEPGEETGL